MANLVHMVPKGMVQGEASQGNLVNEEKGITDVKGSGKGNIHSSKEQGIFVP